MEEIIFPEFTPVFPDVTTETIYKIATFIFSGERAHAICHDDFMT